MYGDQFNLEEFENWLVEVCREMRPFNQYYQVLDDLLEKLLDHNIDDYWFTVERLYHMCHGDGYILDDVLEANNYEVLKSILCLANRFLERSRWY